MTILDWGEALSPMAHVFIRRLCEDSETRGEECCEKMVAKAGQMHPSEATKETRKDSSLEPWREPCHTLTLDF